MQAHDYYHIIVRAVIIVSSCLVPMGRTLLTSDIKWTHDLELEAGFKVRWDADDPDFLTMEISAPTQGYLGIGFSQNGEMWGSDIAIAWVDSDGIPHIKDFHGVGADQPVEDVQQDYFLIAAVERDNETTVRFHRRWETCDDLHDVSIGNGTMTLIWAYDTEDPFSSPDQLEVSGFPSWHGTTVTQGSQLYVHMRLPNQPLPFPDGDDGLGTPPTDVKVWDLTLENVDIDGSKNTLFMCKLFRFPIPPSRKKYQLIGFRPLITEENESNIYRISLHQCHIPPSVSEKFDQHKTNLEATVECYNNDNDDGGEEYNSNSWDNSCTELVLSWTFGSQGDMFPVHVGLLLDDFSSTLFKLKVHYDNVAEKQVLDSSGIRLFFTDDLRLYSGGILSVGHRISPFLAVPPSQEGFKIYSVCSSECTRHGIPDGGINVFSVMLHSHETGRKIRLRHIRNGKELSPIAEDSNYTYKYQQHRRMKDEVRIFPGDQLVLECEYNTLHRDKFTFGGYAIEAEEMCQAQLYYYPKGNFDICESKPEYKSFFAAFGGAGVMGEGLMRVDHHQPLEEGGGDPLLPPQFVLENWPRSEDTNPFDTVFIATPHSAAYNVSVAQRMANFDWRLKHVSKNLENSWKNGKHYMYCKGSNESNPIIYKNHVTEIPRFQKYSRSLNSICRRPASYKNSANITIGETMLLISFGLLAKVVFDVNGYFVH